MSYGHKRSGIVPPLRRLAGAWLLAVVLPFQAMIGAYLDMRGPLHFHVEAEGCPAPRYGPDKTCELRLGHVPGHQHRHAAPERPAHAERHHHNAHDRSVVRVRGDMAFAREALDAEMRPGWSSVMLAALVSSRTPRGLQPTAHPLVSTEPGILKSAFVRLPERPPRNILS